MLLIYKYKTIICVKQEIPRLNIYIVGIGNKVGIYNNYGYLIKLLGLILLNITSKATI